MAESGNLEVKSQFSVVDIYQPTLLQIATHTYDLVTMARLSNPGCWPAILGRLTKGKWGTMTGIVDECNQQWCFTLLPPSSPPITYEAVHRDWSTYPIWRSNHSQCKNMYHVKKKVKTYMFSPSICTLVSVVPSCSVSFLFRLDPPLCALEFLSRTAPFPPQPFPASF
jgi:hypothetical protein